MTINNRFTKGLLATQTGYPTFLLPRNLWSITLKETLNVGRRLGLIQFLWCVVIIRLNPLNGDIFVHSIAIEMAVNY